VRSSIEAFAADSWRIVYVRSRQTRSIHAGNEHFGYLDGVSQPGIRGQVDGTFLLHKFLQPSQNPNDPDQGLPGADLLWPGEFVFGYPTQVEDDEENPAGSDRRRRGAMDERMVRS